MIREGILKLLQKHKLITRSAKLNRATSLTLALLSSSPNSHSLSSFSLQSQEIRMASSSSECSICLTKTDTFSIRCGHGYCAECLIEWTEKGNMTCPLCRAPYKKHGTFEQRLATFKNWSYGHIVDVFSLAAAGFVHACGACGGTQEFNNTSSLVLRMQSSASTADFS